MRSHEPTFRDALGPTIFAKARVIEELGNLAVHGARPCGRRRARRHEGIVPFSFLARAYLCPRRQPGGRLKL